MKVEPQLLRTAWWQYQYAKQNSPLDRDLFSQFMSDMGITTKQWQRFNHTGRLKVRASTVAKFEIIDKYRTSPHLFTLLKIVDAQKRTPAK